MVNNAWPREKKFKTSFCTFSWIDLLSDTEDDYPIVLAEIKPLLTQLNKENRFLPVNLYFHPDDNKVLPKRYPKDFLAMLNIIIPDDPATIANEMDKILEHIKKGDPNLTSDPKYILIQKLLAGT